MRTPIKFKEQFDWFLVLFGIFGIAMYFWGTTLNGIVSIANNGSMPIDGEPDVFVSHNEIPRHFAKEGGSAKLLFLSDRIRVDFPEVKIPKGKLGEVFQEIAVLLDYPLEGGLHRISIGDMLRWVGATLFFFFTFLLLVRIPFRLAYDRPHYEQRKIQR